jgi:hypothetical protein
MPGTNWYCMPTKVFEYGASNIASLVPATNSIKTMFNENEVLFIENYTLDELYNKLKILLNDKSYINYLANNLRLKLINQNNKEKASIFYKNLFNELLE